MSNNIIAAVPIAKSTLAVWFEGGISKCYDRSELGLPKSLSLDTTTVEPDGTGLRWNDRHKLSANDLLERGSEIDFVTDEKHRLLRGLSTIRREASFSQTRLGEAAGIRQSVISRIEGCEISPQINTLLKLLAPLGKTLAIVDLQDVSKPNAQ